MFSQYSNNLIIAADDFGVSKLANERILELARGKKLDRVAVMVGGIYSKEEIKALLDSGVKLDIHLYVLLADYFQMRGFEARENIFKRIFVFLVDMTSGRYSSKKVRLVWQTQIEQFKKTFGKYPDGINSHEHLHFFPGLFRSALRLKDKFSVPYLRLGKEKMKLPWNNVAFVLDNLRRVDVRLNKLVFAPSGDPKIFPGELNTSDYLVSFDWIKNPAKFFERLPAATQTELVFHPERDDEFKFLQENF
ncbi:MAG: ChbG/HpnK family deacetylase [Candidatus Pacebacteria bacterium]|nr:ChbG/HpnK family deacetylase [Candidatus Paceibacterota bacterium]MDR3583135.1 ChbG/HpnK family deacetylase [Candidatus Paceibacterota bacterium]